jgi:hypothetical protein
MRRLAVLALMGILAGCGAPSGPSSPAATGGNDSAPAIPSYSLQTALKDGLCEVISAKDASFDSRWAQFVIYNTTDKPISITIKPGWLLKAKPNGPGELVTVTAGHDSIAAKNSNTIEVGVVETEHAHYGAIDHDFTPVSEDHKLYALMQAAQKAQPPPSWNVMAVAVAVMLNDDNLKGVRAQRYSTPGGNRTVIIIGGPGALVAYDNSVIDDAGSVLKASGADLSKYKLFTEADAALAKALAGYSAKPNLQDLDTLGFFRRKPEAYKILAAVFDEKPETDRSFHEMAYRWLSGMLIDYNGGTRKVDQETLKVLTAAYQTESDETLKRQMLQSIQQAGAK